eukprot:1796431-Pyramimonas_sp.AAC.1
MNANPRIPVALLATMLKVRAALLGYPQNSSPNFTLHCVVWSKIASKMPCTSSCLTPCVPHITSGVRIAP